ncbi:MAG: flagellar biosynthesis anti-sigma factor FlgM [Phycisphaerales bacterium]|jgi:anti-sigma28 factor (negative regulator of flagellin synthesis)|nr:flagellar biosynthesis anti-sigma factor FlgM [Phycisphaerales bacterium]
MSDLSSINAAGVGRTATSYALPGASAGASAERVRAEAPVRGDRAEFSETARALALLKSLPELREDLVARIRTQIHDGTYETQDKLDAALGGLLEDIDTLP